MMKKTFGEPDLRLGGGYPAVIAGERFFAALLPDRPGELKSESHRVFQQALGLLRDAGVSGSDVVRTRIFYVDDGPDGTSGRSEAMLRAVHGVVFDHPGPALTAIRVACLPGEAFVQVEIEAVRGAGATVRRHGSDQASSSSAAVRWQDEVWLAGVRGVTGSGAAAAPGSTFGQTGDIARRTEAVLNALGAEVGDVVSSRHWMRHDTQGGRRAPEMAEFMRRATPTSAGIAVAGVGPDDVVFMFEVDAVAGAAKERRNVRTGRTFEIAHNYCRSVRVGQREVVYVAGSTSLLPGEIVQHPGEVAGQVRDTLETVRLGIEQQGLSWQDLVRTRTYIVGGPDRVEEGAGALREVIGDMKVAASLSGVPVLGRPEVVVEIEATAVRT